MRKFSFVAVIISLLFMLGCEKQVSVSPPDEPPPDGSISLESYPPGFLIYVNGKYRIRSTPDSLKWLETGSYDVLLRKDLFLDTVFTVDVIEGERTNVFIDISKNPRMLGNLSVTSKPEGALIYFDDSSTTLHTPNTFKKLLPDMFNVTLKLFNHKDYSFTIPVKSNQTSHYEAVMVDTTIWDYFSKENSDLPVNLLTCLAIDKNDVKWIGSREGAVSFNGINWNVQVPGSSELPHQVVTSIAVDSKNAVWIATVGGVGIAHGMKVDVQWSSRYTGLTTDYFNKVFIKEADKDIYYFGTDAGLAIYAFDDDPFTQAYTWRDLGNPVGSSVTSIWSSSTAFMIGSLSTGIAISTDVWRVYNRLNSNIPGNSVPAMYESIEGIWIGHLPGSGTSGGLSLYKDNKFSVFTLNIPGPKINTIFVDSRNIKWIGTDFGLFGFKEISNKVLIDESNSGLPIKDVTGIDEDSKGNIWFTTQDNGLFELKKIDEFIK